MSDFGITWTLTRGRLIEAFAKLNHAQLNWRLHPKALTIAESALHVAGVEISFAQQLTGVELNELELRIKAAATDGSINDKPFPFSVEEMTPAFVSSCFEIAKTFVEPLIDNPSAEVLAKELAGALGQKITGEGALSRLSMHPAYHQGQAYLIQTAPGFPA